MKLQDLAAPQKTKQIARVMESHFGTSVNFESLSNKQAHTMLTRVRGLISEHRRQPEFHSSERNPAYLKLVMMEQALSSRITEQDVVPATAVATTAQTPQQATAMLAQQSMEKQKQIKDQMLAVEKQKQELDKKKQELQKQLSMAESGHSLRRKLKESEVQQAQVVLASQDMVDQVQKMIEDVTSMQFKDLPALIDSIRNEVGVDQAQQFNADATAALAGLTQNLQGSKGQLETALGVVTGQAPMVPGTDSTATIQPPADNMDMAMPAPDEDEEEVSDLEVSLGRGKR